ncbi:MAG: restriction endonuclease subunit S, partial [Bacteroidota bacterium]
MRFGLEEHIVDSLISVFEEHSKVDKAIVFGSRAKGNYRPDSDIDIAIKGQELTTDDIILMAVAFEAEGITYKIDLIDYNKIKEPDLKAHIERVGIEFYSKWRETEIGVIPFNWDFEPMENYISLITYGFTNPMPTTDFGPYMLTAKDIFDGKIQYDDARRTSQEAYDNLLTEKSKPKINDVLITKDGSIGRVAIVEKEDMCISQSVALVRTNSRIKPLFLKYLLEAPQYQKIIQRDAGGSTIEHIYITRINKMFIGVPNLSTQDSIIDVIHSLQLKINLLQRQNKTLEQLAETLFRQWFVEEDQNGSLSEYIKVIGGYAFKSKDFKENGYAGIIKITNISMGYIDISRCDYVDKPVVENIDEKFK